MSKAPKRPADVPAKAWWDEGDNEWVLGPIVGGEKHGDFTFWRPDGTKCNECRFEHGAPHGPFKRFHETGEISQDGAFEKGQLHGTRRWFSIDGETTENTRPDGVHERVWRSEMDYVHGRVVGIRHFDRDGARVLPSTGEPYPERPASVDAGAEYVEPKDEWNHGAADGETQHKTGPWKRWTRDGTLKESVTYVDDELHGPATLFVHGENPFSDGRLVQERGEFRTGLRGGRWELCDASGAALVTCDYGDTTALEGEPLAAYSNDTATDWAALARKLEGEGRVIEALVTWGRAAGVTRDTTGFRSLLTRVARPLAEPAALALAEEVDRPRNWLGYELVEGAFPAVLLNKIAIALDQAFQSRAALDFTNAAILLAPTRSEFLFTRALILMSLGLRQQALLDADALAVDAPDRAKFLTVYLHGLFGAYDFGPARVEPVTTFDDLPEKPERSLEDVQLLAQKYASRLQRVRDAMLEKLTAENPVVPPDLSALLPEGPVELDEGEIELPDDETVSFDEVPVVQGADLPTLARLARADWAALSWLCWACGETEVTIPGAVNPPASFGKAAGMAQQRLWRARDQRVFNGHNARQHGVPSFTWEGEDIGDVPPPVAGIAEQEYAELQALFLWLCDAQLATPWQDNLRGS